MQIGSPKAADAGHFTFDHKLRHLKSSSSCGNRRMLLMQGRVQRGVECRNGWDWHQTEIAAEFSSRE